MSSRTTSQKHAREIMGHNYLGIVDFKGKGKLFQELPSLRLTNSPVPFSEDTLTECRESHLLVFHSGLSIVDILLQRPDLLEKRSWSNPGVTNVFIEGWNPIAAWAKEKGTIGWHLVRKNLVPGSLGSNWNEQQSLLSESEETPKVCLMVYSIIGYYLATGEQLFRQLYAVCSDSSSCGRYYVMVGRQNAAGHLQISHYAGHHDGGIGGASARKPDVQIQRLSA